MKINLLVYFQAPPTKAEALFPLGLVLIWKTTSGRRTRVPGGSGPLYFGPLDLARGVTYSGRWRCAAPTHLHPEDCILLKLDLRAFAAAASLFAALSFPTPVLSQAPAASAAAPAATTSASAAVAPAAPAAPKPAAANGEKPLDNPYGL
jgi:hypothetical protein